MNGHEGKVHFLSFFLLSVVRHVLYIGKTKYVGVWMSLEDPLNIELTAPTITACAPISPTSTSSLKTGKLDGVCVHCKGQMGNLLGVMSEEGPLHNECVAEYRRQNVERCAHCDNALRQARSLVGGKKLHPECVGDFKMGKAYVPPRKVGVLRKFSIGRSIFGRRNWKERYFILSSEYKGMKYFESEADALAFEGSFKDKQPKGEVVLVGQECRLITKPTFLHHKEVTNANRDLVIVFKEAGKERRLLLQFNDFAERQAWVAALETVYVRNVDDPIDYKEY